MNYQLPYWMKGENVQNFGDYLTDFFMRHLFHEVGPQNVDVRIVGSCIDDGLLGAGENDDGSVRKTIFWGCGLRHESSLSERARDKVEILAVRGPLSRSALRLGAATPIGDPGLLLQPLYNPTSIEALAGRKVLVPHFLDMRSDDALLEISGCDVVIRPNIDNTPTAVTDFIDAITSADFVLCGALHAAITMAAYGGKFAFWESGSIDLPFKWRDFAASVQIPCEFAATIDDAQKIYTKSIGPNLLLPALSPLVAVAPFPVRADAMAAIVAADLNRHGGQSINTPALASGSGRLADRIASSRAARARVERDLAAALSRAAKAEEAAERADTEAAATAAAANRDMENVARQARTQVQAALSQRDISIGRIDKLTSELAARQAAADASNAALALERDQALLAARTARAKQQRTAKTLQSMKSSTSWQALEPFRRIAGTSPTLRRFMKVAWWTVTLQLPRRYATWRRRQKVGNKELAAKVASAIEFAPAPSEAPASLPTGLTSYASSSTDLKSAFEALHGSEAVYFPAVENPEVTIIIPAYRGFDDLITCLRSLAAHRRTEPSFEVIVVDDSPDAPVLWALPRSGGLVGIQNEENLGFLLSCNRGAAQARGRVLCFLNSDTIVTPGWLGSLVSALDETPRAGLSGSMLLNRDGTIQDAGWRIMASGWGHSLGRGSDARDGSHTYRRVVDCVTGACFCINRATWDKLGGFDKTYAPAFYEEFDLAFRARQLGMTTVYEPRSRVVHLGSASYGAERRDQLSRVNHETFSKRFADILRKQPHDSSDEYMLRSVGPLRSTIVIMDISVPVPQRHAGDVTMASYMKLLADAGWRVVFAPYDGQAAGAPSEELEAIGVEMIRAPQTIEGWLTAHGGHVQHVWLCRPDYAADYIPKIRATTAATVTYYTHDLHHLRLAREASVRGDDALASAAQEMRAKEMSVLGSVDQVLTPSDEEGVIIKGLSATARVLKLPPYFYGADEFRSCDASHFQDLTDVLFVGGFPHTPNVDAALYLADEVMPLVWKRRPEARLVLVGYAPPPEVLALACERIVVTGQVPELQPWLARSRMMLAGLRYGAGVKGKVVEALRNGLPVVTTTVGAEGIGIVHGRDAIIADDAAGLAAGVLSLLDDPDLCAQLSIAGADTAARQFSVGTARASVEEAFAAARCAACGSVNLGDARGLANVRESFLCRDCFALGRCEALAQVLVRRYARQGETSVAELVRLRPDLRFHELGFVGGIAESVRGYSNYSVSEYFPGVPLGEEGPGGVQCQDVTALTFADESFDVVVSQDVMEHVPDPVRGFRETARVLRPGGAHLFTIPQNRGLATSVTRAVLGPDGVEHILDPEYHGDPVRAEGALVFTDYGRDLPELLSKAGLVLVEHEVQVLGADPGTFLRVFEALKPES